jgi:death-on-curing protein
MDIQFLDLEDVLMIHTDQISRYGGSGAVRDKGLLESAIAMPQVSFSGQMVHADLYEMAAAYLYHIVLSHPFVDGNKRTGLVCAIAFLELNRIHVKAHNTLIADFVLLVAQGLKAKEEIAAFLKKHSEPAA